MKNILQSTFFLFVFFLLNIQIQAQDCEQSTAQINLNGNNVNAGLLQSGSLWWDGADGKYIVPQADGGAEVSALFAGGIWLGGQDQGANLKAAAATYGAANGDTDYWPGPLSEVGTTDADNCQNWDRFFKVNGSEIANHINDWSDGSIDNEVPNNILGWPARGNPYFYDIHGFELPVTSAGLAPFYDQDGDANYDPMDGDYPLTKSASQAIWWVFNDNGGIHTVTQGVPIQMEIQMMAYAYASTNEDINNATYYDMKLINRAVENIESAYISLWVDPDLGCYTDDYVGCIPEDNLAFVYNADAIDGDVGCECFGVNTYCEEIPIVGIKLIQGPLDEFGNELGMSSFIAYNNGGVNPPPPPGTTDPSYANEYYNLMKGRFIDGSPMLDPDGNETQYLYSGNPGNTNEWSMCSEGLPSGDKRMLMNFGPFLLQPGAVNSMTFAVVTSLNENYPCPDISNLQNAADNVADFLENPILALEASPTVDAPTISLSPNPFTDETRLSLSDVSDQIENVLLFDLSGKLIRSYEGLSGNALTIKKGNLSKGMYMYKMQTRNGLVNTGKLISE